MNKLIRKSVVALVLAGGSCLVLSGCAGWSVTAETGCSQTFPGNGQVTCDARVSATKQLGNRMLSMASQALSGALPDASAFSMNTSGSTVAYPSTGQVTITLTDSSSNSVVAAQTFPWVKTGYVITLANPAAVNAWAAGIDSSADQVSYQLVPFATEPTPGNNTIAVASVYQGQTSASASSTFCYSPRTPPSPVKPIDPCL